MNFQELLKKIRGIKLKDIPIVAPIVKQAQPIIDYLDPRGYQAERVTPGLGTKKLVAAAKATPITAANLFGASKIRPGIAGISALLGGTVNKAQGKSFVSGAREGLNVLPKISALTSFTNPLILKGASRIASNFVNPVATQVSSRIATGVANIPEGIAIRKSLGLNNYSPGDAAFDFGAGAIFGAPGANFARAKATVKAKPSINATQFDRAVDILKGGSKNSIDDFDLARTTVVNVGKRVLGDKKVSAILKQKQGTDRLIDLVQSKLATQKNYYEGQGLQMGIVGKTQQPQPQQAGGLGDTILYRGENLKNRASDTRVKTDRFSTSTNPTIAEIFKGEGGNVTQYKLKPNAKVVKFEDLTKELLKTKKAEQITTNDVVQLARNKGFDAIDKRGVKLEIKSRINPSLKGTEDEIQILNKEAVVPFNKSIEAPKVADVSLPPSTGSIDDLLKNVKLQSPEGQFDIQGKKVGDILRTPQTENLLLPKNPASPGGTPPKTPDDVNIEKLREILRGAEGKRGQQEQLYTQERGKRFGNVERVGKETPGKAGYYAQLEELKGRLPKVQFDEIESKFEPKYVDSLFDKVESSSFLDIGSKVTAKRGLLKMLQGEVPQNSELDKMGQVFGPELVDDLLAKRGVFAKLGDQVIKSLSTQRALLVTADFSMTLRQSIVATARHPIMALKNMPAQFKAFFSDKYYKEVNEQIVSNPNYPLAQQYDLPLSDMGRLLGKQEEQSMASWADHIPIIKDIIKGSNRAAATFLNKMRMDMWSEFVTKGDKLKLLDDPKYLSSAAKFIGAATGRGGLGAMAKYAPALNATIFSPRLAASRLYFFNPHTWATLHPEVRKEALLSLLSLGSIGLTVVAAAKASGAETVTDPRNSDFGKIKIGNTRIDPWGGFQQYLVFASRFAGNKSISSITGKETELGEGFGAPTRLTIAGRFLESKLNPTVGMAVDAIRGKNFEGQPFDPATENLKNLVPLIVQEATSLVEEQGLEKGLLMTIPAMFGVGVQTYAYKPKSKEELKKAEILKDQGFSDKEIREQLLQEKIFKIEKQQKKVEMKEMLASSLPENPEDGLMQAGMGFEVPDAVKNIFNNIMNRGKKQVEAPKAAPAPQDPIIQLVQEEYARDKTNRSIKSILERSGEFEGYPQDEVTTQKLIESSGFTPDQVKQASLYSLRTLDSKNKASIIEKGIQSGQMDFTSLYKNEILTAEVARELERTGVIADADELMEKMKLTDVYYKRKLMRKEGQKYMKELLQARKEYDKGLASDSKQYQTGIRGLLKKSRIKSSKSRIGFKSSVRTTQSLKIGKPASLGKPKNVPKLKKLKLPKVKRKKLKVINSGLII